MSDYGIAQNAPVLNAKSKVLKEACLRAASRVADAQQIVHDLGLGDDCTIQVRQSRHAFFSTYAQSFNS